MSDQSQSTIAIGAMVRITANRRNIVARYRSIMHYDGAPPDEFHAIEVDLEGDVLQPETTKTCTMKFFYPEYHAGWAVVGASFELRDGAVLLRAKGIIESINYRSTDAHSVEDAHGD